MDGSNRLTRRNRRFLRAYKPAVSYDPLPNVTVDEDVLPEPDWGARGVNSGSKPLSSSPGEHIVPPGVEDDGFPLMEDSGRSLQEDSVPSNPVASPRPNKSVPRAAVRKSERASRGKTSRFDDFITGQGLEGVGE